MSARRLGFALLAVLALAPLAVGQKGAAPVDLGTLGGSSSQANGINPVRTVVGFATVAGDTAFHAFRSTTSGLQDLGTLVGPLGNSSAASIGPGGSIAGTSDFDDPVQGLVSHAFYWQRGAMSDVGTLGGSSSQGNCVQTRHVAGSSLIAGDSATHGFYRAMSSSTLTDLGTLGGTNSHANGCNAWGESDDDNLVAVVGDADTLNVDPNTGNLMTDAVLWIPQFSKSFDLGTLGGSFAGATAINHFGFVVGFSALAGDNTVDAFAGFAFRLPLVDIGSLGGSFAQATAVNDTGTVVGFSNTAGDADVHAFKWTHLGGMVDLNSRLPAGSPWVLHSANGISPNGTIVGVGTINGESHAFAW